MSLRLPLPLALALSFTACRCGTPPPTRITLRVTNTLAWDIFLPNDSGQGGMTVLRPATGAALSPVAEAPPCPCLSCEKACDPDAKACDCTTTSSAHRVKPGQAFTRTFEGSERQATRANCGTGDLGPVCYQPASPLPAGTYTLRLCFAGSVGGGDQGLDDFATVFPEGSLTCVDKSFRYPEDTVVEVSPPQPAPCTDSASCPAGQLCQEGRCSASCLANDVPPLGASWNVSVVLIDDEAFFTASGADPVRFTGTGQVGQVSYDGNDMQLALIRPVGVGHATAKVEVLLPPPPAAQNVPFFAGETLSLTLLQAGDARQGSTAMAIRDAAGGLVLAADEGLGGPLLSGDDLQPFTLTTDGPIFACDASDECGRRMHRAMTFSAGGTSVALRPGQSSALASGGRPFNAVAVADYRDERGDFSHCGSEPVTAFAVVQVDRQAP